MIDLYAFPWHDTRINQLLIHVGHFSPSKNRVWNRNKRDNRESTKGYCVENNMYCLKTKGFWIEREREEYHFYLLPKIVHHPRLAFPVSISLQGKMSINETSHMLALSELSLRCKEMPFEGGDISIFSLRVREGEASPSPTPPRPRHCVDIALSFFLWGGRGLKGPSWLQFCC